MQMCDRCKNNQPKRGSQFCRPCAKHLTRKYNPSKQRRTKTIEREDKRKRVVSAESEFNEVAYCARSLGVELVKHSPIHFKLRGASWVIDIWPSTQRTLPDLKITRPFTLMDVLSEATVLHNLTCRGSMATATPGSTLKYAPALHTDTPLAPIHGVPW